MLVLFVYMMGLYRMEPYILVQGHLTEFDQGKVLVRPDFGDIEESAAVCLSLLGLHHLHVQLPDWILSASNSVPQILIVEVSVHASHSSGVWACESGDTRNWLEVEFHVAEPAIGCYHLECMHTEARNATDRVGEPSGTEEVHESVDTLGLVDVEVPELKD